MTECTHQTSCRNIFRSQDAEDISDNFTNLWILVIKNQENSRLATLKNNVLQADIEAI